MGIRFMIFFFVKVVLSILLVNGEGGGLFKVKHKFGSEADRTLIDLVSHDHHRHGRLLSAAIDIPLSVSCGDPFCSYMNDGPGCSSYGGSCGYHLEYADRSETAGYIVTDTIRFDQVAGNHQTTSSPITFGCGVQQSGNLVSPKGALDGIVGFGAATTSILSQLASTGKVRKKFAHCLDGKRGGGIFVIGEVMQPKLKTTPLVAHQTHYNVIMESVQVGEAVLTVSELVFRDKTEAIIDSCTTLAYLPLAISNQLRQLILASQPNLSIQFGEDFFECFEFNKSIDDSFPTVTFGFENSLQLNVYPHDYLIQNKDHLGRYCLGWQDSMKSDEIILGDLVLTNKLVLYDLEDQVLGLAEYNCSSPIGLDLSSSPARYNKGYQVVAITIFHVIYLFPVTIVRQ
ncbi:hypothetical protein MKX03_027699 [Papaver bracteatum]|nr:hypothetical protein MKX03_027699 [Papaver bracteatum]